MKIEMLRNLEGLLPFNTEVFKAFIGEHCDGFEDIEDKILTVAEEVSLTVFEEMNIKDLLDSAVLVSTQNIQNDIEFDKLATRILLTKMYKEIFGNDLNFPTFEKLYTDNFKKYINEGIELKLLNPKLSELFDLESLSKVLQIENDENFDFIGLTTLESRYAIRDRNQKLMETPQYLWMRIAMGLSFKEDDPTERAKTFYKKLSNKQYIPGGSTNIGAGTTCSVLSNCYLMETQDDINSIYDNIKNIALISKATGGIGISVTKLRAAGSPVRSNNTLSTGPIPFIKVMDAALKSMSRAGKKYGAMCIYMENWHINFPEFLDLKQNAGDDYRRIRTADTAVYISDEFMKRVVNHEDWYMFNPDETPELAELYGSSFSKKYNEYVQMAKEGKLKMFKVVPASEQMKQILTSLQSTSHPWLTWKDNINLRALNNNTGTIHCSNLCTEITLPQDENNIAVCNLAYINLATHVNTNSQTNEDKFNWETLEETVRVIMRHLDNLVEVNELPVKEAQNSDTKNRAVGMGMSGFSEALELLGYSYDSQEAFDLMDKLTEFISYVSIDESCNLAEERGSYENFEGSLWSKGFVPFDTIEKIDKDRLINVENSFLTSNQQSNIILENTLTSLKDKIESGIKSASTKESKELYEIFSQLAQILEKNQKLEPSINTNVTTSDEQQINFLQPGKGIKLQQNRNASLNWDKLRERVKKGIRNATTMAIAPNASTGLVLGTSPGIDPRFAQVFSRQTSNGKFLDINQNLVKDLLRIGIWDEVKDEVLENYGDIQNIELIPDEIKKIYKTSFQISPYAYIEVASRAQKWIDQSLSRNMYLETRDIEEMIEIYTDAWRRGLKTTYYLHVKPRHQAEQSTIKVNKAKKIHKSGFGVLQSKSEVEEVLTNAHTAQTALTKDQPEIKGFGFAVNASEEKVDSSDQPVNEESTVKVSGTGRFGFGVMRKDSLGTEIVEKHNFKAKSKFIPGQACPLDPAERAQCEACQ